MADSKSRVICVGEVMVELSRGNDGRYGMGFGGDTFNTAVYLARAGIPAAYATAMGDDPYSDGLMALATAEGVNGDLIRRMRGRMPGLYLIETDAKGERKFYYWRETSPARDLFELPDWAAVAEALPLWSAWLMALVGGCCPVLEPGAPVVGPEPASRAASTFARFSTSLVH